MKFAAGSSNDSTIQQRPVTAPPVYHPVQGSGVPQRPATAPPVYRPVQTSGIQQRSVVAPPVYRPPHSLGIPQRPVAAPLIQRPLQGSAVPQHPPAPPPAYRPALAAPAGAIQSSTVQAVRKSGKRRHKLAQRSGLKRAAQSERDKADAADTRIRSLQQGNLYSGLTEDEVAWDVAKATTAAHLPAQFHPELVAANGALQNMGLEADTRFSTFGGQNKIIVRYDTEAPTLRRQGRVGRLAQTLTHELYVHGQHGLGRDDPDQDHLEMHDPGTRDAYVQLTRQALARLQNRAQERAFLNAWRQDMRFQIETADDLTDTERRKRLQWVNATYATLMPQ